MKKSFLKKSLKAGAAVLAAMGIQATASAACFVDNYNYTWDLEVVNDTASHLFFSGTMTNGSGTNEASAIYTKNSSFVSVASDFGTGFHYSLVWGLTGGSGAFINTQGSGSGTVTSFAPCTAAAAASAPVSGRAPGE